MQCACAILLHWSTKILSHEEKCPFLMYFWTLNWNMFPEFLFCPMKKNAYLWCIFGRWIEICFQNFSITHTFRSRLKGWNFLRQNNKVRFYFTVGAMKNSRISPREMVSCFAIMFVPLCKFLAIYNPDQLCLFTDSSKVILKVVLFHNRNKFPSVTLAHAANMKELWKNKAIVGKD
jgi:hypothetical protein